MTTPNQSSQDPRLSDQRGQQCMLYLLGELDAEQSAAFEQQLQSSPEMGDELLRQADVIHALSQAPQRRTLSPSTSPTMRWPIAASIVAVVAACFAIIVFMVQSDTPNRIASLSPTNPSPSIPAVSEDLLIARAWADSRLGDLSDDFVIGVAEGDEALTLSTDEIFDVDSTLSWMFIAVSANIDDFPSGATNDG